MDEALVERVARAMCNSQGSTRNWWADASPDGRDDFRAMARAAIAACFEWRSGCDAGDGKPEGYGHGFVTSAELRKLAANLQAYLDEAVAKSGEGALYGSLNDAINSLLRVADRIDSLTGSLARATEWQPIETAPRDGTSFWGCADGKTATQCVFWKGRHWTYWELDEYEREGSDPTVELTHWLPLPPPPVMP